MDLSLNTAPQGMPNPLPGTATETAAPIAKTQTGTLPLVEQPIKDHISQSTEKGGPQAYFASAQVPILDKPKNPENLKEAKKEVKEEKKTEHSEGGVVDQTGPESHIEGEQEPQEKGDQQQGGDDGGEGGSSGSGSSGSSSGGSKGEGGKEGDREPAAPAKPALTAPSSVHSSTKTETDISTNKVTADATTQSASTSSTVKISPLDQTTHVSESGLFSPPINPSQFFDNGGKLTSEMHTFMLKFTESLPDGPEKMRFIDFLSHIQKALVEFQTFLHSMQGVDSKGVRERSKAQLETTLAKIELQRKEQEQLHHKQQEAAQKMAIMGPLMAVFAFLMFLILAVLIIVFAATLLMMGPYGWMALGMLVCEMVDQAAAIGGKKPFLMKEFMGMLTSVSDKLVEMSHPEASPQELVDEKLAAKTAIVSVSMALAFAANPGVFLLGGVMALLSFLTESHIIRDNQMQVGKSETDASMAEMYATIAIAAAFAIAAIIIAFIMPAPAIVGAISAASNALSKAALKAAEFLISLLNKIIDVGEKAAASLARSMQNLLKTLFHPELWLSVTSLGLQTTNSVITYRYQSILADIALIHARMDAATEVSEATMLILKKMIKQLLESIQGAGQDISQLGNTLKQMHRGVSDVTNNLFAG